MIEHFVLVAYRCRGIAHQIFSVPGLGKRDDVTNAVRLAENGNQAVKAECNAAVRWAAAGQRLQEMIQRFCVFAENFFEDVLLQLTIVYSD